MKKNFLKRCSVNEILTEQYVTIAKKNKDYTPLECEKIKYALNVILNECEKIFLLILYFGLQKQLCMFFLSLSVIVSMKNVLGGTHRKTFWGCFFFSLFFFEGVVVLVKYTNIDCYLGAVLLLVSYSFVIVKYAPIQSKQKVPLTLEKKRRYQWYSFILLLGWIVAMIMLRSGKIGQCVFWTLFLQVLEIIRMKGGEKLCSIRNG